MKPIKAILNRQHASKGNSMIEMAFSLPIMLMLVLGVVDFSRSILFNNILIYMSREGAHLASRFAEDYPNPIIIKALNSTADPLVMNAPSATRVPQGMIYITHITGVLVGSTVAAIVQEQYRTPDGKTSLLSRKWQCPSWDSTGKCIVPTATNNRVVTLPLPSPLPLSLDVYFVETIYDYIPITNYVMKNDIELYSFTLL